MFIAYLATVYPSVPGGDAGELLAAGCSQSVAHPPGYPILTLLVSILSTQISNVALAVNLVCCGLGAIAVGFIGSTVRLLTNMDDFAGFTAGVLYGFSSLVWEYSIGSEVFALNNALAAAIVYLTVKMGKEFSVKDGRLGAFLCGLGLSNQHTIGT